ncbi:MAG: PEP-CTERM system TPR-repeat protein PrsT [Gammaproteobacteria bacterium]|nr:PEP-CTERM system TPR-repeat protein PrsT [Gammaproteobacteria bacterium]MDH5799208.1 PEP-CTERM system TPR-repeat protein PrsT [Gammaproteobacteria bacterium]
MRIGDFSKGIAVTVCSVFLLACSGKSPEVLLNEASEQIRQGNYRIAIINLKNVLKQKPDSREGRFLLGKVYLEIMDGVAAEKELLRSGKLGIAQEKIISPLANAYLLQDKYAKVIELIRSGQAKTLDAELSTYMAQAYLGLGDLSNCEEQLNYAMSINPDFVPALLTKSKLLYRNNKYDDSKKFLNQITALDAGFVPAWLMLGEVAASSSDYNTATQMYQKALDIETSKSTPVQTGYIKIRMANVLMDSGEIGKGTAILDELLAENRENPIANYLYAVHKYKSGDRKAAYDHLQLVLKAVPDHKPSLLLLGAVNFGEGKLEQTDVQISKLLQSDPTNPTAIKLLGATHLRQSQPEQAQELVQSVLDQNPNDSELLDLMGSALLAQGETEKGLAYIKEAVSSKPESVFLRNKLASIYLKQGEVDLAVQELENTTTRKSQDYRSQVLLILSYLSKKNFLKAEQLAAALIEQFPNEGHAGLVLVQVYLIQKKFDKTEETIRQALTSYEDYTPLHHSLVRLYVMQGELQKAEKHLNRMQELFPEDSSIFVSMARLHVLQNQEQQAIEKLDKARVKNTSDIFSRLILTRYYLQKSDKANAGPVLSEAETLAPKRWDVKMLRAIYELRFGDRKRAKLKFQELVQSNPKLGMAHYYLGTLQMYERETQSARNSFQKAMQLQPSISNAYLALGRLELISGREKAFKSIILTVNDRFPNSGLGDLLMGDYSVAKKDYKKANALYANTSKHMQSSELLLKRHYVLHRLKRSREATLLLQNWLKQHPNDVTVRKKLAWDYKSSGQVDKSIREYRKIVEIDPKDASVYNNLAWLLFESQDSSALEVANKAYMLAPDKPFIVDTYGWLQLNSGNSAKALALLEKAAELAPVHMEIQLHYAEALQKNSQTEKANRVLEIVAASGNKKLAARARELMSAK